MTPLSNADVARRVRTDRADHLGLAFYRHAPDLRGRQKKPFLDAVARRFGPGYKTPWGEALEAAQARAQATRHALAARGWTVRVLRVTTATRLAAGLGYAAATDNGLSLHPLLGAPYLPGTSVKGLARAWNETVLQPAAGATLGDPGPAPNPDVQALRDRLLDVCGSDVKDEALATMRGGRVRFFDALPDRWPQLAVDVLTPHEQAYYQGQRDALPQDRDNPIPVPFLTVDAGAPFTVWLAARSDDDALADLAAEWLARALDRLGAGGKTAAGYGTFRLTAVETLPATEVPPPLADLLSLVTPQPPAFEDTADLRARWQQRPTQPGMPGPDNSKQDDDGPPTPDGPTPPQGLQTGAEVRAVVAEVRRRKSNARVYVDAPGHGAGPDAPTPVLTKLGDALDTLAPGDWVRATVVDLDFEDRARLLHYLGPAEPSDMPGLEGAPDDDTPIDADPNQGVVTALSVKKGRVRLTVRADTGDDLQAWDDGAGLAEGQRVRFEREDRGGAAWASDLRPE